MRRQVWLILGGLAAGVALVSLLAFDAGYVLVQFGQYRLETTLVAAGIALFLLLWIVRVSFRFLSAILGLGPGFGRWLEKRREDKASALLRETLIAMFDERTDTVVQRLPKLMKFATRKRLTLLSAMQPSDGRPLFFQLCMKIAEPLPFTA